MKVILKQDVPGLGKAGEIKEVDDDDARDYLLSKGYATRTTKASTKHEVPVWLRRSFLYIKVNDDSSEVEYVLISPAEAELLQKINQGLPAELGQRYSVLIEKRDAEELTPDEHEELLTLTEQIEQLEAQRVAFLVELARLRNTTITELIQQLGIRPSVYV